MQTHGAGEVGGRCDTFVEHADLRRVAHAEHRAVDEDGVLEFKLANVGFAERGLVCSWLFRCLRAPTRCRGRSPRQHWMLTATGFWLMCVCAHSMLTARAVVAPPKPCGPMPV